jgi:hypothetical protein
MIEISAAATRVSPPCLHLQRDPASEDVSHIVIAAVI